MNKYLIAAALVTVMLTSCDSEASEEKYVFKDSTGLTPANQVNTNPQPNVMPVSTSQPNQQQPMPITLNSGQIVNPQMPVVTTSPQTVATTATAPGMNPPHGQPNHRCDIAVGAPLNSKPAAQPVVTQPVVTQPVQADAQQATQLPVAKKDSGQ